VVYDSRTYEPKTLPRKRCKPFITLKVVSTKAICPAISFWHQTAGNQMFQIWRYSQWIVVFVIPVAWLVSIGILRIRLSGNGSVLQYSHCCLVPALAGETACSKIEGKLWISWKKTCNVDSRKKDYVRIC